MFFCLITQAKTWIGVDLFNFEREFSSQKSGLVATQAAKQSAERLRRDVFESHRHRTFALAFYMTGNELEAERILTGAFVRAFQQSEQPDAFGIDSALIAELSERFSLSQEQSQERSQERSQEQPAAAAQAHLGSRNVRRTDLEAAIQDLPPDERFLFLLRDVEGYSPDNIAKLLQISVAQVQQSLFSARIHLCQGLAALPSPTSEAA
jgi:RNA polymerase sigma factor (sigma-70 family)